MARLTARALPWGRLLAIAQAAVAARQHWDRLEPAERARLTSLVRKSRGRPWKLSAAERSELRLLVGRLELRRLARDVAALTSPLPRRRKGR